MFVELHINTHINTGVFSPAHQRLCYSEKFKDLGDLSFPLRRFHAKQTILSVDLSSSTLRACHVFLSFFEQQSKLALPHTNESHHTACAFRSQKSVFPSNFAIRTMATALSPDPTLA